MTNSPVICEGSPENINSLWCNRNLEKIRFKPTVKQEVCWMVKLVKTEILAYGV